MLNYLNKLFQKSNQSNSHEIKGFIGYFNLSDWWEKSFTKEEVKYIHLIYQPLGDSSDCLTIDVIEDTALSIVEFLSGLASWFKNKKDINLAFKFLKKAEECINETTDILDVHYFLNNKIEIYYYDRENKESLEIAIKSCKKQINISNQSLKEFKKDKLFRDQLPSHKGYEQLAIIEEKNKNYNQAIELAKEAFRQCWYGDWEKRIERCTKKISKN